jgi:hypothetical protein
MIEMCLLPEDQADHLVGHPDHQVRDLAAPEVVPEGVPDRVAPEGVQGQVPEVAQDQEVVPEVLQEGVEDSFIHFILGLV